MDVSLSLDGLVCEQFLLFLLNELLNIYLISRCFCYFAICFYDFALSFVLYYGINIFVKIPLLFLTLATCVWCYFSFQGVMRSDVSEYLVC